MNSLLTVGLPYRWLVILGVCKTKIRQVSVRSSQICGRFLLIKNVLSLSQWTDCEPLQRGDVTVVYLSILIMHMASHCAAASWDAPVNTLLISVPRFKDNQYRCRLVSLNIVTPQTGSILPGGGVPKTWHLQSEIRVQTHQSRLMQVNTI